MPQRQTLRIASRSASLTLRFFAWAFLTIATAVMICPGWQKPHCATSLSSQAACIGCRSLPTVAGRPSIVVILSEDLICEIGTEQGLKALPLMWLVQASAP